MPRDKLDVARRVLDAYNRRDIDGLFAELATPDFVWYPVMVRGLDGGSYRGREGVERFNVDHSENWEELQGVAEAATSAIGCLCWVGSGDAARPAASR